jgi:hypothetical protein
MRSTLFLALFALAALVSAQQFQDIVFIDDFLVETPTIVIVIPQNPSFPIQESRSTSDSDILGGERDLRLTVLSGNANLVLSSGVAGGDFSCAAPNGASGTSLLQWDGTDGSITLQNTGLNGFDLTQQNGQSFRTLIESDQPTTIDFRVYTGSSMCTRTVSVPGDDTTNEYILQFSSFTGGCSFSNVGAIEIFVNMGSNVDVLVEFFATYGPVPTTPSPSRTPTPTPSQTGTPTPRNCVCQCPVFTCEVFRVDDEYVFYSTFYDYFFNFFFDFYFFFFDFYFFFYDFYFFYNFFDFWYWFFSLF